LKPCGYLNSIFGEGLDNYIALLWPLESNHFQNGIPPTPSPPWCFHLLFLTQIFHLCAASGDVEVAVSGWRLMFGQIRAQVHNFDHEDFSEDSTQHSIEDFAEGFSEDSTADSSEDQ
jgi:hypothetical protein